MASRRGGRKFGRYVPVEQRRWASAREAYYAKQLGRPLSPVSVGKKIAYSFWGKTWCRHIESFHDFANRLPRGRTYVRNGSVIDLSIEVGAIKASVMGSTLYSQAIEIAPCPARRWRDIVSRCAGGVRSLVELLEGRLADEVMKAMVEPRAGLLPDLAHVEMTCTCPDWAHLCKHLAAVLYGVGARLDEQPELLFTLRGVSPAELIAHAAPAAPESGKARDPNLDADLEAVFGITIDWDGALEQAPAAGRRAGKGRRKSAAKRGARRAAARITRAQLLERGVPAGTIATWLRQGVLVATDARGVYQHTRESRARLRARGQK